MAELNNDPRVEYKKKVVKWYQRKYKAELKLTDNIYWAKAKFVEANESDVVLFSGTLFHGNILNTTQHNRISINCRFKNLFSPAGKIISADRGVGIFYKLLSESVATEIGREYMKRDLSFEI